MAWFTAHPLVAVLTSTLSVVLFLGSYYVNVQKPAAVVAKVEAESRAVESMKVKMSARGSALDDCLTAAESDAKARWNAQCRREHKSAGCALSRKLTQVLQREAGVVRNACLMKYSLTQ
ncbi:MAG TPA: hypothetical protein VN700_14625 [Vicinamibacterales bacterium]|nr:hypothetical protein [Vicinamibacterales bacterium]